MSVKPESNDKAVIRIMTENAGKSRDEVVAILMDLLPSPPRVASGKITKEKWLIGYYNWGIGKGAPGEKIASARAPKTTEIDRKPKTAKPKLIKVPKPRVAGAKEQAAKAKLGKTKTAEEIADIRAKNLARLKAVGTKYAKGTYAEPTAPGVKDFDASEARAYVQAVTDDLDNFKAPSFLSMDEVKVLV